ncbi:HWE histidine kinase domain-containing protein [Falsiroseomonas sp. HW251]|uniref:HWE histidine kinase domain-containing protein n=1 Tax=Falsiroseomonas sp. HW251 TaxID=3390998 RepID=UPI003D317732
MPMGTGEPRRLGALVLAALTVPLLVLAVFAWLSWRDTWNSAERELARGAEAAAEYARRVLDIHLLAADLTNHVLRGLSDEEVRVREGDLHRELRQLLPSLPGVNTVVVLDREADVLLTGNIYPVPRGTRFPDREWVVGLREPDAPDPHISAVTTGRLDNNVFFGVSRRRAETGNGLPTGAYDGLVNVSVDPNSLSAGLAAIAGPQNDSASLVRADGAVLARSNGMPFPPPQIPAASKLRDAARAGEVAGTFMGQTVGLPPDQRAGEARLIAFRRVGELPLYATVARPTPVIVARWRETFLLQLAVGLPAWACLVVLALLLQRKQRALTALNAGLERRVEERTAALRDNETKLRIAQQAARTGTFVLDPDTGEVDWSDEQYALFGLDRAADGPMDYARFLDEVVHPEDRALVEAAGAAAFASGEFEADFRVWRRRPDGTREMRWMTGRGRRLTRPDGGPGRMFGVNVDITDRKAAEERQALLMREVGHRAKNALAVVQAALRLTRKDDAEAYAQAIEGRVAALARAHTILAAGQWESAALRELVEVELATFQPDGVATEAQKRVTVEGPDLALLPDAVQALSMAVHELATNAAKYGALSVPEGRVWVTWRVDSSADSLTIIWRESGGPRLAGAPKRQGFGSRVIEATVRTQLGGRVKRVWEAEGLVCVMTVPVSRVLAAGATDT